jgi:hypothetical protein
VGIRYADGTPTTGSSDDVAERSVQHGQRIDDAMDGDVEGLVRGAPVGTHARDDLDPELADTPVVGPELGDDEEHLEVIQRSDLARYLRPSAFPGDAQTLLAVAREEHAPDGVLVQLEALARDAVYRTIAEVWEGLGHETEHRDGVDRPVETEPEPAPESLEPEPPELTSGLPQPVAELAASPSTDLVTRALDVGVGVVRTVVSIPVRLFSTARRLVSR